MNEPRPTLVLITTSPLTLWAFFRPQLQFLASQGFEVHAVSSPGELLEEVAVQTGLPMHAVAMRRRFGPFSDVRAVLRLWRLLRRLRPSIVHTHTPKAGLLGVMASLAAGVRVRIYTINGLPLMTQSGWRRRLLMAVEKVACAAASEVLCVSHSLRQVAVEMGLCPAQKIRTLGDGASHGVDLERFDPDLYGARHRKAVRERYGIPPDALLVAYVGRIVRDKGMEELAPAWKTIRSEFPNVHLLLCGIFERDDPISPQVGELFRTDPAIHLTGGMVDDMPAVYAAMDVCVLPTYREGLPNVALECAAMKVPLVATRIPGCVDALQDGVTGLLVEPRDARALAAAMRRLLSDADLRPSMGQAGHEFVSARFSQDRICQLLLSEYRRLLIQYGLPLPRATTISTSSASAARG